MLQKRALKAKDFKNYEQFISHSDFQNIKYLAKSLKNKKIIHLNSTPEGGGVAEILRSIVPLLRSLDLDVNWYFIENHAGFFQTTKKIYDCMQGFKTAISTKEKDYYLSFNQKLAQKLLYLKPDLVIVHDIQPLAIVDFCSQIPMILRIHLDSSHPEPKILNFLLPYFEKYKGVIFSIEEFVPKKLRKVKHYIVNPAIDPLESKNVPLTSLKCQAILTELQINFDKPLIAQISRFDFWKDPLGVIEAFYLAKKEISDLQLALVGLAVAQDDPSALRISEEVEKYARKDPDIFIFTDPETLPITNELLVNAIQSWANPVLQKSIKEGFGLTVTEAMWKRRVVIGGNVGGIKVQIEDEKNGFLVDNPRQAAERIIETIKNRRRAKTMGEMAKETVKKKFLIPELIKNHLRIYNEILNS